MRILSVWLTIVFWTTSLSPLYVAYKIIEGMSLSISSDFSDLRVIAIGGLAIAMTGTQISIAFLYRE